MLISFQTWLDNSEDQDGGGGGLHHSQYEGVGGIMITMVGDRCKYLIH